MTYDPATYTVTTTVADNGDGTLSVQHTLDGPTTDNPSVTFNNTYETTPAEVERFLRGTKTLTGRDALEGEKFSFEAKQVSGPEGGVSGFSASAVDRWREGRWASGLRLRKRDLLASWRVRLRDP